MISVTKIFRFEMGHAIDEYDGMCKYVHGHSYVLHVTVTAKRQEKAPLPPPGFVVDFKVLKRIVKEKIISRLDHALVLSERYIQKHPNSTGDGENVLIWPYEPSAENILYFIRKELQQTITEDFEILRMKLWETSESYAEWEKE